MGEVSTNLPMEQEAEVTRMAAKGRVLLGVLLWLLKDLVEGCCNIQKCCRGYIRDYSTFRSITSIIIGNTQTLAILESVNLE